MRTPWYRALRRLADGKRWSRAQLMDRLGCDEEQLTAAIDDLRARGLRVAEPDAALQLGRPIELLDAQRIQALLDPQTLGRLRALSLHPEIDSTSSFLRREGQVGPHLGQVCLAERQTAGRGRQGRSWVSPLAAGLWLSLQWRFPVALDRMSGLSVAVAVAVADALGDDVAIKWPNDLYVRDRKLGGILIEVDVTDGRRAVATIGVGINLDLGAQDTIDQPWIDLLEIRGSHPPRNALAADLISALVDACERFAGSGLASFAAGYGARDWLAGQHVEVSGADAVTGQALGIDDGGRLGLKTPAGVVWIAGGEVSVRRT